MLDYTTIILILILLYVIYYFNYADFFSKIEKFRGGGSHGGGASYSRSNYASEGGNIPSYGRSSPVSRSSTGEMRWIPNSGEYLGETKRNTMANNLLPVANVNGFENAVNTLKMTQPDINITDNKVDNAKDFPGILRNQVKYSNKLLGDDNKEVKYYYNDYINQSDINENACDLVNNIDLVDYSNIKTGLQKCEEECDGVCFELGYMGNATCYPKETKTFDYGSIYKNPTFIYG
jgi:hypothetical protein